MHLKTQRGFGLGLGGSASDLVVPVVIVVVLGLIAYPVFDEYRARARVAAAMTWVASAKVAVEKAFVTKGPADMSQSTVTGWSAPVASEHLQLLAISKQGVIIMRFADSIAPQRNNELHIVPVAGGKALDLSVASNAGRSIEWQCGGPAGKTTLPEKLRPTDCR